METATGRWSLFSFKIGQLLHKYPTHQEIILKIWNFLIINVLEIIPG